MDQFGTSGVGFNNAATRASVDSTGLYVVGYLGRNYTSAGSSFVKRFSSNGSEVWFRVFSTDPFDISGISVGTDGIYIQGSSNTSITVWKYDTAGNELWATPFGSAGSIREAISATHDGVYGAGIVLVSDGTYTPFVRKFDLSGNIIWDREFANGSGYRGTGTGSEESMLPLPGLFGGDLPTDI